MLVLTRKQDESLYIGKLYTATVLSFNASVLRLLVDDHTGKAAACKTHSVQKGDTVSLRSDITLKYVEADNLYSQVRIGIDAPDDIKVDREPNLQD